MLRSLVVLLAASTAAAAPPPKDAKKAEVYFPTKVGAKWVYQQGSRVWADEVTKVEAESGGGTRVVVRMTGGEAASDATLRVAADGLMLVAVDALASGHVLLKFPPMAGARWAAAATDKAASFAPGTYEVESAEDVAVPAGTYRAYPVKYATTAEGKAGREQVPDEGGRQQDPARRPLPVVLDHGWALGRCTEGQLANAGTAQRWWAGIRELPAVATAPGPHGPARPSPFAPPVAGNSTARTAA